MLVIVLDPTWDWQVNTMDKGKIPKSCVSRYIGGEQKKNKYRFFFILYLHSFVSMRVYTPVDVFTNIRGNTLKVFCLFNSRN